MKEQQRKFQSSESGQGLVEWALVLCAVGVVVILVVALLQAQTAQRLFQFDASAVELEFDPPAIEPVEVHFNEGYDASQVGFELAIQTTFVDNFVYVEGFTPAPKEYLIYTIEPQDIEWLIDLKSSATEFDYAEGLRTLMEKYGYMENGDLAPWGDADAVAVLILLHWQVEVDNLTRAIAEDNLMGLTRDQAIEVTNRLHRQIRQLIDLGVETPEGLE